MLAKILGLVDLLCVIILLLVKIMPHRITMIFAMLLTAKGFIFIMMADPASFVDAAGGIYMGLIVYGFSNGIITLFFMIYLGQKGVLSLFAR